MKCSTPIARFAHLATSVLHSIHVAFPLLLGVSTQQKRTPPYLPQQVDGGVCRAPRAHVARERERRRRAREDPLRVEVAHVDLDGGVVLGRDELVGPRAVVGLVGWRESWQKRKKEEWG